MFGVPVKNVWDVGFEVLTAVVMKSQSHVTTDDQSVSKSWDYPLGYKA
jgi:hypothetical protein